MKARIVKVAAVVIAVVIALGVAVAVGYGVGSAHRHSQPSAAGTGASAAHEDRKVLYWYDPMYPQQHFDKPGKSPFMDMQLVPKYADEQSEAGVQVDARIAQNLGVRLAVVKRESIANSIQVAATVSFNERDVAIVQARTGGFVERVYERAAGDVIPAGSPLADVLVPDWAGAQQEFLAVKAVGDAALTAAARQRLMLLGMPDTLITRLEQSGAPNPILTITSPTAGVIQELGVRSGMSIAPGMTLARINGLSTVWLEAAVPEAQAALLQAGRSVQARFAAYPGEVFKGKIAAVLPEANSDTRTLRVRMEFRNPAWRLKAGMYAQVSIAGPAMENLVVPAEAVLRTGKRTLVFVSEQAGRYRPVEIETGREMDGKLEVLKGLQAGQQVVTSGQFLLDSEASLAGVATPGAANVQATPRPQAQTGGAVYAGVGSVKAVGKEDITLAHEPIPQLEWGAMTMPFKLGKADQAAGLKVGDRVRFRFSQQQSGSVLVDIEKTGGGP